MHGINKNKNRQYNKMKVNKKKYKKIKKKNNKKGGGAAAAAAAAAGAGAGAEAGAKVLNTISNPLTSVTPTQPPQPPSVEVSGNPENEPIIKKILNIALKALSIALIKWKGITQYIKGLKDPRNLFCGLFPNDSNLRKLFEKYLDMKSWCPIGIGGNSNVSKNKTRKRRKKLSYKFRKITSKNNYIGGDNGPSETKNLDKRKIALEQMKNNKSPKKSLQESIPLIKGKYYLFFNSLDVTYLYKMYFTLINIKNAAIYQILLDLKLQEKIGEVYKSLGNKEKALESLSSEIRLEITKTYEKEDLFLGFKWFNFNYHAITDTQTIPSLLDSQILEAFFSENPNSLSIMLAFLKSTYGYGNIDENSLEAFLFLNMNQMNISREEKDKGIAVKSFKQLLNEESVNDEDFDKLLSAIGKQIAIQENVNIKQIIKRKFLESRKIYNSPILFGKNKYNNSKDCQLYFWEQIPKTYENITEYMNAFDIIKDTLELNDTEMLSDLKLEFKKGLYPHMHEFDIQTTTAEEMNDFMERINSPNYNIFKDSFYNTKQLISTYKFIEYTQLIYIIEVVLFKKIYFEKFLAEGIETSQGLQLFEKDINYLTDIDTVNEPEDIKDDAAITILPKYKDYAENIVKQNDIQKIYTSV